MKVYKGQRFGPNQDWLVIVEEGAIVRPLDPKPSQKINNHSPDGFSWGYGGSGPAQLALAILLDAYDEELAKNLYQDFKWDVISKFPMEQSWELPLEEIELWIGGYSKFNSVSKEKAE